MNKILFRSLTIEYSYSQSKRLTKTNSIKVNLLKSTEEIVNTIKLYIPKSLSEINIINNIYHNINNTQIIKINKNNFLFCIDCTIFILYSDSNLRNHGYFVKQKIYFKGNKTQSFPRLRIAKYNLLNGRCVSIVFNLKK